MSFYWRWVVVRTAVAAMAGFLSSAASHYSAVTWGTEVSTLFLASWAFAVVLIALAEGLLLQSRFPTVRHAVYAFLSSFPFVLIVGFCIFVLWRKPYLLDFMREKSGEADVATTLTLDLAIVLAIAFFF